MSVVSEAHLTMVLTLCEPKNQVVWHAHYWLCSLRRVNPNLGELRPYVGIQCVTVTENVGLLLLLFFF